MKIPHNSTFFLGQEQSFEQWSLKVRTLAYQIAKSKDDTWLLFEPDSYLFSIYFFALAMAGKSIVLPQNGQPEQLTNCMQSADIYIGRESSSEYKSFNFSNHIDNSIIDNDILINEDTPIVFFTSGSSGLPKAINKTFGQLIVEVTELENCFGNELGDSSVMSTVSHQHIYGLLFKLLWPIWAGRDVFLKPFEYPEHLVHEILNKKHNKVCLIGSPAYFHRLVKDNVLIECEQHLNVIFSSGGPLDVDSALTLQKTLNCSVIEVFGSTETGGIGWRQRDLIDNEPWNAFNRIVIKADDVTQRLSLKSPYINGNDWFEADDRVLLKEDNKFQLLGRIDRVVKIEEKRCSLDEIESMLAKHEYVNEVSVIFLKYDVSTQRDCLGAVISLSPCGEEILKQESKLKVNRLLKQHLKSLFETLVIPRKFRYIEQLPYNAQGKLDKKLLEQLFD